MLDEITPIVLTYNEEPNLDRTLARLEWARDIVIVDSFSTDRTMAIAARHSAVRVFQRPFDTHAQQWSFAIEQTNIRTAWILALDADYVLSPDLVEELRNLKADGANDAYRASFRYCVEGMPLRGALYPPVTVLFRRCRAHYVQDGHTQRLRVDGPVGRLKAKIDHDDRKPLSHWLLAQDRYMRLEAEHVARTAWSELSLPDKIRRLPPVAPFLAFAYCYFGKRVFLDGRAGLHYALQRLMAEALLALRLVEIQLNDK
jgi:glycosyltransferase involved in cell wall biosynthesis